MSPVLVLVWRKIMLKNRHRECVRSCFILKIVRIDCFFVCLLLQPAPLCLRHGRALCYTGDLDKPGVCVDGERPPRLRPGRLPRQHCSELMRKSLGLTNCCWGSFWILSPVLAWFRNHVVVSSWLFISYSDMWEPFMYGNHPSTCL